jgi:tetratricopeptide (TPR) repeat protein
MIKSNSASAAGDTAEALAAVERGRALAVAGNHTEAANVFLACQKKLPNDPAPWLNRAASLLALGDSRAAVQEASEACHRAPNRYETHYTYGLAWLAENQPRRAEEAFAAALRLNNRVADAWVSLGVARYRQDNIEGAKQAMRSALVAAPGHRAATSNLAAFLHLTGEYEDNERMLRDLLSRDPAASEARLNLVAQLLMEDQNTEVLELLDAVPMPDDVRQRKHWLLQRSLALVRLKRTAEAEAALREAEPVPAPLAPLLFWRKLMIAVANGDREGARAFPAKMDAVLHAQGDAVLPEHRIMGRYDLARFWSTEGDHEKAMANWTAGHAQLRRFQPFSRDDHRAFVDANIEAFGAARFAEGARAGNTDAAPIFIVGMPRSGTTLVEQILAAHPDVYGAGERTALHQYFHELAGANADTAAAARRIAASDATALDRAATAYLAQLHALAPHQKHIVDKMPGNFNYLGLAGLMLPGAKIIHCTRDARDIGLSIFTFRFYGHHPYAHDLADLGWYIGEHDRLMAHWKAVLPNPVLTLRLDDWVRDFDGTLRRVLAFVGLPYDSSCERFYENEGRVRTVSRTQVKQPVNNRGIDRWRPYAAQLEPLIAELRAAGNADVVAAPAGSSSSRQPSRGA